MSNNLQGKRILITGADGFIGSHLTEMLYTQGAKVRALAIYNSQNTWGWLETSPKEIIQDIEVVNGDVRDSFFCQKITQNIDIVFNLASLIAIPYSYTAPQSYVDTNINGALNMAQASLQNNVERLVQISTSEVYGTALYVPIDEKHPLQPQSPYSASKIGADAMAMSYYNAFNLPVTLARPFNTFGERQSARAVIPTIISQIASGKTMIDLGDTSPTRDFNYVLDTCKGLISLLNTEKTIGEVVNISSNYEISIGNLFEKIKTIMQKPEVQINQDAQRLRPKGSEVMRLWGDNTKIKNLTGFAPSYTLDEGLERTIKWFLNPENLKQYKTNIYNV